MLFATVTGCFLLTGFIPAQTAQAPVGEHVLKEIAGNEYTYTPSFTPTSHTQQKSATHPANQTEPSAGHVSQTVDRPAQSPKLPVIAMKPENKSSVTEPTYDRSNSNADHSGGATFTNDRKQPTHKPSPVPEPSSSDQPSRKPTRNDSGQPSQTEPGNPPDSQSPPPNEQQPQPPDNQPGDGNQGNDGNKGDNGLIGGILGPVLDTLDKTLP
jgi:hypothetical protein